MAENLPICKSQIMLFNFLYFIFVLFSELDYAFFSFFFGRNMGVATAQKDEPNKTTSAGDESKRGIRAVLIGPPGSGKGTQVNFCFL